MAEGVPAIIKGEDSPVSAADVREELEQDLNNFVMKNGCCRECMRAFSKTGKVSFYSAVNI